MYNTITWQRPPSPMTIVKCTPSMCVSESVWFFFFSFFMCDHIGPAACYSTLGDPNTRPNHNLLGIWLQLLMHVAFPFCSVSSASCCKTAIHRDCKKKINNNKLPSNFFRCEPAFIKKKKLYKHQAKTVILAFLRRPILRPSSDDFPPLYLFLCHKRTHSLCRPLCL